MTPKQADVLAVLERSETMYESARSIRIAAVAAAREQGLSWYAIADRLGMSAVAARRLHLRNEGTARCVRTPRRARPTRSR
jgi:transposase